MKPLFFTIPVKHRVVVILLLVVVFSTGCGFANRSRSKILEIKPIEEIIEEKYKKLQTSKELTLETNISSQIFISKTSPYYRVSYLKAKLKVLPTIDHRQNLLSLEGNSPGKVVGSSLEFILDPPSIGFHEFKVKTEGVYRFEFVQVTNKIPFPFQVTAAEQIKYMKPSKIIDSDNENIGTLAASIAKGEDDLYRVVFKAGKWVIENVNYEFSNSTVYTSQKASWVLENREGVCDEKTNLFIGLVRSLGIPAKFITGFMGIRYNHKITYKPHSWAEVYFPSVGWIPFDVTNNQLGFIDANHIKLAESADASDSLTVYEWKFIDVSDHHTTDGWDPGNELVSIKDLQVRIEIKQEKGIVTPLLEIDPKVWHSIIDVGSYNIIEATVVNPHEFYVTTDLSLQIPSELKIMGDNKKMILLEPNSRITEYWILKSTIDMKLNMTATVPIKIISSKNFPTNVEFYVAKKQGYPKYSFERLKLEAEKKFGN